MQPDGVSVMPHTTAYSLIPAWVAGKRALTTRRNYTSVLSRFVTDLHSAGLALTSDPLVIAAFTIPWLQTKPDGGEYGPASQLMRRVVVNGFFDFAVANGMLARNPISGRVARISAQRYAQSRALPMAQIQAGLHAIDRTTLIGRRDYALLAIALSTGRRLSELVNLTWGDVEVDGETITLTWHTKGGKFMRDRLSASVGRALFDYLHAIAGPTVSMSPLHHVWRSFSRRGAAPLQTSGLRWIVAQRLKTTEVHRLRHTFAHAMHELHADVTVIQARLGHSRLDTTAIYLRQLTSDANPYADDLTTYLGIE